MEASAAKSRQKKLKEEKAALLSEKEQLDEKISGVKPHSVEELRIGREKAGQLPALELELVCVESSLEKARKVEDSRKKLKDLGQMPSSAVVKSDLDNWYRVKHNRESELRIGEEEIRKNETLLQEISSGLERSYKSSSEEIDKKYNKRLREVEKTFEEQVQKINDDFKALLVDFD